MPTHITHDMLSVEEGSADSFDSYKVVAWSIDGVPCTVDTFRTYEEAMGFREALKVTLETWG